MKRIWVVLLCCALFSGSPALAISADTAQSAILLHADTGQVLYEKDADTPALIASTTKVMTALVVLEHCGLEESVEIRPEYTGIEGSSMYLAAGQSYTVKQLLYGLLLVSGNDAAVALACYTAGSTERFAEMMNEKAARLGLENTHFENPHGLDGQAHYSTARDLAVIMRAAMDNADFADICGTKAVTVGRLTFVNHNKLLWRYQGCIGGKTGYTMAAGRSLVTCAERDGMRLICVTLSDPDDWNTHTRLYDWAFENYCYESIQPVQSEWQVPLISGMTDTVKVGCVGPVQILKHRESKYSLHFELPGFVYAPIAQGEALGRMSVLVDGAAVGYTELCALESAPRDNTLKLTAWERFRMSLCRTNKLGLYYPAFRSV